MAIGDKRPVVMEADRAAAGGIATLGADGKIPAAQMPGYGEGAKQDGVKGRFFNSGGAVGWYRIATTAGLTLESQAIVSLCHQWSSGGKSDLVCLVSVQGGVQCIKGSGASATNQSLISNMRLIQTGTSNYAIDVYSRSASRNPWQINIINTGNGAFSLQTPTFVASDDTLPDGETLLAPMEWLNPPMEIGKEYRTTERYMGLPVYVQVKTVGSLEANVEKGVTFTSSGCSNVVRAYAIGTDSVNNRRCTPCNTADCTFSCTGVLYKVLTTMSARAALIADKALTDVVAVAYYTKSTD